MQHEDRDNAHLWDMLSAAREVAEILGTKSLDEFEADLMMMRAIERCIEIIGEAARRISAVTRDSQPRIPWTDIIGQRNILAREYGQIDYELLYKTAAQDVPRLVTILAELLPRLTVHQLSYSTCESARLTHISTPSRASLAQHAPLARQPQSTR
jgi:uncharacterized protein with HEPN domain